MMKLYDMKCPVCGHINHNLYLEETDGWMECEKCMHTSRSVCAGNRSGFPLVNAKKVFLAAAAQ